MTFCSACSPPSSSKSAALHFSKSIRSHTFLSLFVLPLPSPVTAPPPPHPHRSNADIETWATSMPESTDEGSNALLKTAQLGSLFGLWVVVERRKFDARTLETFGTCIEKLIR
ncbi:hypothetical protein K1719_025427 [Acacia pycnantha]|nr:hypothetical protein K1719_025427 [Acacia pycnantha]